MNKILVSCIVICLLSLAYANDIKQHAEIILFEQPTSSELNSDATFLDTSKGLNSIDLQSGNTLDKAYLSEEIINTIQDLSSNFGNSSYLLNKVCTNPYSKLYNKYSNPLHKPRLYTLGLKEKTLTEILKKISRNNNRPIMHVAIPLDKRNISLNIQSKLLSYDDFFGNMDENINGILKISANRNIDIKTQLEIDKNNEKKIIIAERRMRPNQLNYIDKGKYGLLVIMNKVN